MRCNGTVGGGSHWILTGRYDPEAQTGSEDAPGHRCGDYANARGNYGFWSDDDYAMRQYLHMGLSVGDATAFEIEFIEVERSGFAGIRLLNDPAHSFADFYAFLRRSGITVWGAAVDTLENTSRFAEGRPTGPMSVIHLFDSPLTVTRPYEAYFGNLTVPRAVARRAGADGARDGSLAR